MVRPALLPRTNADLPFPWFAGDNGGYERKKEASVALWPRSGKPAMTKPLKPPHSEELTAMLVAVGSSADRIAFQSLFNHCKPRLTAFMQARTHDTGLAEEIVQETMANVWRKAHLFDAGKASAMTWIYTIARNIRIDMLRKANRPTPDMNDPAMVPDPDPDAEAALAKRQDAGRLRALLAELPVEQRQILELAFFEELSHAVIAKRLDIPIGTVKSRIRLAFKRMRTALGD